MEVHLPDFLSHLEQDYQYSSNTIAAYRNDLSQFLQFLQQETGTEQLDPQIITEDDIEAYLDFMKKKDNPYASSTIARKVAAIKSYFNYLDSLGLTIHNPSLMIDSPKVKKQLPRTLTTSEVDQLLKAPNMGNTPKSLRDRALLHTLYETGMRVTEIVSLVIDDIDFRRSLLSSPTRQGASRDIPLTADTLSLLEEYLKDGRPHMVNNDDEKALFLNHRGEKLTRQGLWLIIKGYAKECGLKNEVTPHTLRHSFAVHHISQGAKLEDIQRLLGHANISTTQIYTQMESAEGQSS